jgi:hypothetical protein
MLLKLSVLPNIDDYSENQSHIICLRLEYGFPTHAIRSSSNLHLHYSICQVFSSICLNTRLMIQEIMEIELRRLNCRYFSLRCLRGQNSQTNEVVINKILDRTGQFDPHLIWAESHITGKNFCRSADKRHRNWIETGTQANLHKSLGLQLF